MKNRGCAWENIARSGAEIYHEEKSRVKGKEKERERERKRDRGGGEKVLR
jgi:hypothetical protein